MTRYDGCSIYLAETSRKVVKFNPVVVFQPFSPIVSEGRILQRFPV